MQPDEDNTDLDEIMDDAPQTTQETTETPPEATPPAPAEETPQNPSETSEDDKGAGTETPPAESETPPSEESETPAEEGDKTSEEAAKPLTAAEVVKLLNDQREQERNNSKAIEETTQEVLKAYHPDGLPEVVTTEDGKELRTPQDVVDASGGQMSMEEAASWLMNEQAKLDRQVDDIKKSARDLAETNYNFKQGAVRVLEKYQPIFDKYPQLQQKIYKNYMKTVRMDSEKDLILAAPDIEEYYADVMEPYVMAFSYQSTTPPAAAPAAPAETAPAIPESKQTVADRLDISGDAGGGGGDSDADPNDPEASLNNLFGE